MPLKEITESLFTNPSILRAFAFIIGLSFFTILETRLSFRHGRSLKKKLVNFSLVIFNSLFIKSILLYIPMVGLLEYGGESFGLFYWLGVRDSLLVILSFIVLDLAIYWQHRLFHTVAFLWRFHEVHHSDACFDTSTALRFHTIEILLSLVYKILIALIFGIPISIIIYFEITLNFLAMFNHSNFRLPLRLEWPISKVLVTPSFHRVHHSPRRARTNSNYGFCLSWWDYIFYSFYGYKDMDQKVMEIGLERFKSTEYLSFTDLLALPFKRK